jgi:hypothetical protein
MSGGGGQVASGGGGRVAKGRRAGILRRGAGVDDVRLQGPISVVYGGLSRWPNPRPLPLY